jgi:hypothetical protein
VDDERVGMNLEEPSALVAGQSAVKSGSKSLQKKPSRSASGTSRLANTSTRTMMGSNGHSTGSMEAPVAGQSMENSAPVAGQSMEKSGNNSLQKKASRSASGTSRLANTRTNSMMGSNGHATGSVDNKRVGMDLEASVAGQSMEQSGMNSLQKKASRSASGTSRLATTSTISTMMGSNGHATGSVDDKRVGMDLEAPVAGQSMEKSAAAGQSVEISGNASLQKEISRSASGTSR